MKKLEYIWLDGFQPEPSLRSKVKVTDGTPPDWSFDGSSTQQADGSSSDCIIRPVNEYIGPSNSDSLVMCEVLSPDRSAHPSNTRNQCVDVLTDDWWFGFEQEYFFTNPEDGTILGWEDGTPRPQGDYYCGVGSGNVQAREVSEAHMDACLEACLKTSVHMCFRNFACLDVSRSYATIIVALWSRCSIFPTKYCSVFRVCEEIFLFKTKPPIVCKNIDTLVSGIGWVCRPVRRQDFTHDQAVRITRSNIFVYRPNNAIRT